MLLLVFFVNFFLCSINITVIKIEHDSWGIKIDDKDEGDNVSGDDGYSCHISKAKKKY